MFFSISLSFASYITDWVHPENNFNDIEDSFIEFYNYNDIVFVDFNTSNKIINNSFGFKIKPEKYFKEIYFKSYKSEFRQFSSNFFDISYINNFNEIGTSIEYHLRRKIKLDYDISLNNTNDGVNHLLQFSFYPSTDFMFEALYSIKNVPYDLFISYDNFTFNNQSSIHKKIISYGLLYKQSAYSLSLHINNYDIFTKDSNYGDILYIDTKRNKEIVTQILFDFNQNLFSITAKSNKPNLIGNLKSYGEEVYELYNFQGYYKILSINSKYKDKVLGLSYKSTKFDIIGRLKTSQISDDLMDILGSPNINNLNEIQMDQFMIYFNKGFDDFFLNLQLIYEYYDCYFQSSTPPFNPIIPIINFERMNLKRRIAFNIGLSKVYTLNDLLIKLFFKQQIPIKNDYYDADESSNLSYENNNQYGGARIGFNLYFN